jgi:hypothetical protein
MMERRGGEGVDRERVASGSPFSLESNRKGQREWRVSIVQRLQREGMGLTRGFPSLLVGLHGEGREKGVSSIPIWSNSI